MEPKLAMDIPKVDYKGIFNSGSALYLILLPDDPRFTIVDASDIYLEATMRKREDIVGKGVFEAFPPNPSDVEGKMERAFRAAFRRIMETKKVDVMPVQQYDIPKPDGGFEVRHWSVTHSPILNEDGVLIHMAQRVEDVTELVRLKQHGDKMETEVMLRAREIKEANNKLTEANKELEAFSYTISHDLRAPLRSIISFSNVLLEEYQTTLDPQAKDYLQRIVNAGKRMNLMVESLLGLARLAREEVRIQSIDLSSLVKSLRDQLVAIDPDRKVDFIIEPNMKIDGDPRLLEVALQNLINNAWKFSSKTDAPRIEVGQTTENNERVFFVKDNGDGFDMQYAEKLFGPFQRLHTESQFTGTGIGLATVQKIIQRHKGKIWAKSAPGQGATFFFTLPQIPT